MPVNLSTALNLDVVHEVTLSLDTNAYASGDVLAAPQEITNFFSQYGDSCRLRSLLTIDLDDQGQNIDILFFNAAASIGVENAAFAPDDTNIAYLVGAVPVTGWVDAVNSQYSMDSGLDILMKPASGSTSLWVGAVCREGTPTYSAGGVILKIGVQRG